MRAQNKVRRILLLIDVLSPLRMPFTVQDAMDRLSERSGIEVCRRTIIRDLQLLESMNFAYVHRRGTPGWHPVPAQYKMNLRMTTSAQMAAKKT